MAAITVSYKKTSMGLLVPPLAQAPNLCSGSMLLLTLNIAEAIANVDWMNGAKPSGRYSSTCAHNGIGANGMVSAIQTNDGAVSPVLIPIPDSVKGRGKGGRRD